MYIGRMKARGAVYTRRRDFSVRAIFCIMALVIATRDKEVRIDRLLSADIIWAVLCQMVCLRT